MESRSARPRIALTVGDPAGIGPEIAAHAAADPRIVAACDLLVIGPETLRPRSVPLLARDRIGPPGTSGWVASPAADSWELGRVQASAGRAALAALRIGHELAFSKLVDALVTGPVSKEALHLAGERVEGQTELLGRWCGVERFEMLAIAGPLRVLLVTRHMPLRLAIAAITTERVLARLLLLDEGLRRMLGGAPRLALAGLNPHAGERGLLGEEDELLLRPAVERARAAGVMVEGPLSPDTVFLQAARGRWDGVVALYHDQAFIPIKLLSGDGGVTVLLGLPYSRVSPVHGTAFDLAGKGLASAENLIAAVLQASLWCRGAAPVPS